jgi:hypothetical protein
MAIFEMRHRPCQRACGTEQARCKVQRYQSVTDVHVSYSRPADFGTTAGEDQLSCLVLRFFQYPEEKDRTGSSFIPASRTFD